MDPHSALLILISRVLSVYIECSTHFFQKMKELEKVLEKNPRLRSPKWHRNDTTEGHLGYLRHIKTCTLWSYRRYSDKMFTPLDKAFEAARLHDTVCFHVTKFESCVQKSLF